MRYYLFYNDILPVLPYILPVVNFSGRSLHESLCTSGPGTGVRPLVEMDAHVSGDVCAPHEALIAFWPRAREATVVWGRQKMHRGDLDLKGSCATIGLVGFLEQVFVY